MKPGGQRDEGYRELTIKELIWFAQTMVIVLGVGLALWGAYLLLSHFILQPVTFSPAELV